MAENIKPEYIYADAEEKYVKAVVLYAGPAVVEDTDYALYYDAEATQLVNGKDLPNLCQKGLIITTFSNTNPFGDPISSGFYQDSVKQWEVYKDCVFITTVHYIDRNTAISTSYVNKVIEEQESEKIKPEYIYADAEEKYAKAVVLYAGPAVVEDTDYALYYDAEFTQLVNGKDLLNLCQKGLIITTFSNTTYYGMPISSGFYQELAMYWNVHKDCVYIHTYVPEKIAVNKVIEEQESEKIKPEYIYADAEEKYAKAVVLYAGSSPSLYYDAEATQLVNGKDLLNLCQKGLIITYFDTANDNPYYWQDTSVHWLIHEGSVYADTSNNNYANKIIEEQEAE